MITEAIAVRAWKDPVYRVALSEDQRTALPPNPAGVVELSEAELMEADGGTTLACAVYIFLSMYAFAESCAAS